MTKKQDERRTRVNTLVGDPTSRKSAPELLTLLKGVKRIADETGDLHNEPFQPLPEVSATLDSASIAAELKYVRDAFADGADKNGERYSLGADDAMMDCVMVLDRALKTAHPGFDSAAFLRACGVQS